jgi:predicted RNA-binding protein with RPS1 domain
MREIGCCNEVQNTVDDCRWSRTFRLRIRALEEDGKKKDEELRKKDEKKDEEFKKKDEELRKIDEARVNKGHKKTLIAGCMILKTK